MPLINSIFWLFHRKRLQKIKQYWENPAEVQLQQLRYLLDKAKNTQWGKLHGFKSINSIRQYSQNVPLQKYEDIYNQIELTRQGNKKILWPGTTKWFAKSSGTTNDKSKFIPVTTESLNNCHYLGGRDVLALYLENVPNSKVLTGKTMTLGGSHQIDYFDKNARCGDLSAIMLQNIPFWANYIPYTSKKYCIAFAVGSKTRKVCSIHCKR